MDEAMIRSLAQLYVYRGSRWGTILLDLIISAPSSRHKCLVCCMMPFGLEQNIDISASLF